MYWKKHRALLLVPSLIVSAGIHAETRSNQSDATKSKPVIQTAQTPFRAYNYAYPGPLYGRPNYPLNRQRFNNRNTHRLNGRNDFFGDNRMHHWNRVVSDMVSDMFGDGAGDFEFDMKIKFKADGKGKGKTSGRSRSYATSRTQNRYSGDYRGNYRGRGDYAGRTNTYHGSPYRGYAYYPYVAPYASYSAPYNTYQKNMNQKPATYPSYPPVSSTKQQSSNKKTGK